MKPFIVNRLFTFSGEKSSKSYKIISLIFGVLIFLCVIPGIFILLGLHSKDYVLVTLAKIFEIIELTVSILGMTIGLFFLVWAALTLWKIGKEISAPNAPPQYLVITGPYKLCRNPIELGAVLYYLGIGTFIGGIIVGIISFLLGFTFGSIYHKFFEEKELKKRFGEEYKQYKDKTPFIFPRI